MISNIKVSIKNHFGGLALVIIIAMSAKLIRGSVMLNKIAGKASLLISLAESIC